jgi:hypothetical protein
MGLHQADEYKSVMKHDGKLRGSTIAPAGPTIYESLR